MKRWKLWTAVAASVLSVGSGATYLVWGRTTGSEVAQSGDGNPETSPHAEPPRPIADPGAAWKPAPNEYVAQASFDGAANEESPAAEPPPRDVIPGPSRFGPPAGVDFRSTFEPAPAEMPAASPGQAALSDEPPRSEPPGAPPVPVPSEVPAADPTEPPPAADPPGRETPPDRETPPSGEVPPGAASPPSTEPPPPAGIGDGNRNGTESPPVPRQPPSPIVVPEPAAVPQLPAGDAGAIPIPRPRPNRDPQSEAVGSSEASPLRSLAPPASVPDSGRRMNLPPATLPVDPVPSTESPVPSRVPGPPRDSAVAEGRPLVSNAPGERKLEGLQTPSLSVERVAPEEIRVGAPARFVIRVKNVGEVPALDVVVSDQVPEGTRFLSAVPEVSPAPDGRLTWALGAVEPGQTATIQLELLPEAEGEIGSVAAVTFRAQAAVRTIATRPLLKVEHTGPARILIGEDIPLQITVSNPGSGAATGVVVEVDVPPGLSHEGGREIMSDRFDLRPNETRKLDLVLRAVEPGSVETLVRAVGDNRLVAEHRGQLEVIAPVLQIAVAGPTRRFLDRPVKYQIPIHNTGTAAARDVELVARLPRGLKFVSADKKGQYDDRQHAVLWGLEELPPGEQGLVELTAVPTDTGEQKLRVEARAVLAMDQQYEHTTVVEDITDLVFAVTDDNIPIEVGSHTTYQIRVANNGTKAARNIRLVIQAPAGLEIVDFDGPATPQQQKDRLVTQPIPELGQSEEAVFRISAKGTQPGDHVLRVQLLCDEFSTPVIKEEITKVYEDQ